MNAATTRSMTGTGVAVGATEVGELRIELRAVNGRVLQIKQRLCSEVAGLETAFDEQVRSVLRRGTVTLHVERAAATPGPVERAALQQLVGELRALARDLQLPDDLSLRDVLALAANLRTSSPHRELPPGVAAVLGRALDDLQRHRASEGAATVAAMRTELDALDRLRAEAAQRAPALAIAYRDRLLQRVREFLSEQGLQLAAADVVREVALFAERTDVGEELQRLGAHLTEVRSLLGREGIGRQLEFLLQELLREANTLGSKSPDVTMAHGVVAMKSAIDRLKEQAANLE